MGTHNTRQRLTYITLGVKDLQKMQAWYTTCFGWEQDGDHEGVCFFKLNGIILALFGENDLAEDIGITHDGSGFKRFSLAVNYGSEEEVDARVAHLKAHGARVVRAPEKVFWGGYRGYIADPEDNYWELAYNPYLDLSPEGNVV